MVYRLSHGVDEVKEMWSISVFGLIGIVKYPSIVLSRMSGSLVSVSYK